tara:strand:- start:17634 stop:18056 length:423 start_codon:yes stop_codon:yes gene_type:complete
MDTRVWHQVGLELVQVDIESTIEAQAGGDGADDLSNQTVEMLIVGARDIQVAAADIVHSLVVDKERAVGVFNGAMSGQNSIVWLHDRGGDARRGIHGKFELALFAVVGREALQKQGSESRTCTTSKRVENEETLKRGAVV